MRRIGVACPGDPNNPATWSGTPSGVMRGLADAGAIPVAIDVEPPALLRKSVMALTALTYLRPSRDLRGAALAAREAALASRPITALHTRTARKALRSAGRLDGIVAIGTGFELDTPVPIATFEDMTVAQTRALSYGGWSLLSERTFGHRVARQRRAYEGAIACCLTSRWAARSVVEDYGITPDKVHVVGIGRNHEPVESDERDWSTPKFLFVGMDWTRKNGDAVVRAFAKLRAELPDATLDLVGGHPPIDVPGVTGHGVLTLGDPVQHDRLDRLFAESTCFVMPSHSEALGIVYAEAAANGLPSIGTRNGGADFLIGDGGVVVDPGDDAALLDAMRALADPETAARTGAAARRRSELFTWSAVGRRLLRAVGGEPAEIPLGEGIS